jgi:uncharacterized protein YkwD
MRPRAGIALSICALAVSCAGAGPRARGERPAGAPRAAEGPGSTAPERVEAAAEARPETGEERDAARALLESVNAARTERGLRPLEWSEELAAVGRGYCEEMSRTGIIAHESKLSGTPADRARRAKIPFVRLTENLAVAEDAAAAHDGLMHSPGHRENILDAGVTEIGIGAVFAVVEGARSLIVTQVFAAPPERIDPETADDDLAQRLNDARLGSGLKPLARDAWLDEEAEGALGSCGSGAIAGSQAKKRAPFHVYTAVMIEGGSIAQIAGGLAENEHARSRLSTHFGVAVARVDGPDGGGVCAVVLFGAKD